MLRKLVKRIEEPYAYNQFTGTADILETMQEKSLQGIRTVKAFTLEGGLRRSTSTRYRCRSSATPTRWRRSANRSKTR